MNPDTRLRWGFLGAARIAKSYAPAMQASRNGKVCAVAARDADRARRFADEMGIPRALGDYQALLDDPEIDAIYLALPNALHAEWAIRALRSGKHVLCEKPLATSTADAQAMRSASLETGRLLAEAAMYRLHPVNITALELLHSGRIGDLVSADATFFAPVDESDPIRFSPALGGGALLDLGFYCVNLLRWAAGAEPVEARGARTLHPGGVDLWSGGVLRFPSGAVGTFACAYGRPFSCRYELVGRSGRIVCDGGPLCAWPSGEFSVQLFPASGEPEVIKTPPTDHYRLTAAAFADSVLNGANMPWELDESVANLQVLDALRA